MGVSFLRPAAVSAGRTPRHRRTASRPRMSVVRGRMPRRPGIPRRLKLPRQQGHGRATIAKHEGHGMKFTVERDALAEAVTWVARALPARPVVPVLSGLQLRAELDNAQENNGPGWLTLSCFDYEVSARVRVRADVAEPGTFLVPGRLLVEIVRSLPQHPVEFG